MRLSASAFAFLTTLAASAPAANPPPHSRWQAEVLATGMAQPMELERAPDGRIFFIELAGRLRIWKPDTRTVTESATIPAFTEQENGLLGFALDPQFASNQWIYIFYSPKEEPGQRLSRFTMQGDSLDLASEKVVLSFSTQRRECCHHAGSVEFGPDGCLFISTGDNTHPHGDSEGFAPIDERPDKEPWDAQKSSANPNDLRGKILRIKPRPDGSCEIPAGNLFPPGTPGTRPEIYCMGCRNPWRMSVDQATGHVYWGEVGPDAGGDGPRGPRGYDEINQARKAGNHGWPYFIGNNFAYADYDYTTRKTGPRFDPLKPRNDAPGNTGAKDLPPAVPAFIYYPYGASEQFPEVGQGGRSACAGPVFHFRPEFEQSGGFPAFFDNCLLWWDWERRIIRWARLDKDSNLAAIEPFTPAIPIKRMLDAQFGPDGQLYCIDYGETWGANADARLLRISFTHGNLPPTATAKASPPHGPLPLKVNLSSEGSTDPDSSADALAYAWSLNGKPFSTEPNPSLDITTAGDHVIELIVTDPNGATATARTSIVAGNSPPAVALTSPTDGDFFAPDQPITWSATIHDAEEGNSKDAPDSFAPRLLLSATPDRGGPEAPGLTLMKSADCFNCHAPEHRIVGPAFLEIANRYRGQQDALNASIDRVQKGSSGVWGPVPMLPHGHHSREQIAAMVSWVFSLQPDSEKPILQRGLSGSLELPATAASARAITLEATFTDAGQSPASPLTHHATITLRNRRTEAEACHSKNGTQALPGGSASGGHFIGDTNHGQWIELKGIRLDQTSSFTTRTASGGAGGTIEIHADKPDGPLVASIPIPTTSGWESWQEITTPLPKTNPPHGRHDLFLVFSNPGKGGLMNLDWIQFNP
jgi:cytochrome c